MRPALIPLVKARALIADPEKWGKGRRNIDRLPTTYCAVEAIEEAEPHDRDLRIAACRTLKTVLRLWDAEISILAWNDEAKRTHAEVLAAFDKAIEAAS